jgi:hypothetical protein
VDAPIARTLDTAVLTATGINLTVTTVTTIVLGTATLTATGIAAANVTAHSLVLLGTATLTVTGIDLIIIPQIYILLDPATLTVTGVAVNVMSLVVSAENSVTVKAQVIIVTVQEQAGMSTSDALTIPKITSKGKVYPLL